MALCRSWRPKMLLLVGIALYLIMVFPSLPFAVPFLGRHTAVVQVPGHLATGTAQTLLMRKARIAATIQQARGSWAGAYRVNAQAYLHQLQGLPLQIPANLGLMMIGLALFKVGFLSARSSERRYRAVSHIGAVALGLVCWLLWRKDVQMSPLPGEKVVEELLSPLVSLSYASGLILLLRTQVHRFLLPLAAAGRMAFTNYLTQSILMTSIFYGGRGALMGSINRVVLWEIVIAVWALQLVWSPIWLSRFEMGPFEWAWRCMTYGKRVPFLKPKWVSIFAA